MKLISALSVALACSVAWAESRLVTPSILQADGLAYYFPPARQVAYGLVSSVCTSSDSRYIVFQYDPAEILNAAHVPGEYTSYSTLSESERVQRLNSLSISMYDTTSKQLSRQLPVIVGESRQVPLGFVYGTHKIILAVISEQEVKTQLYDIDSKTFMRLPDLGDDISYGTLAAYVPATQTYAFIVRGEQGPVVQMVDSKGGAGMRIPLDGYVYEPSFAVSGNMLKVSSIDTAFVIDVQSGAVSRAKPTRSNPLFVARGYEGVIAASWSILEDASPYEAVQNKQAWQLPREAFSSGSIGNSEDIWFTDDSGLHIIDVQKLSADELAKALAETEKRNAMMKAKMCATAILIYGSDYDDQLPPISNWSDSVMPYIKDDQALKGFVYLLNGQNLGDMDDPAKMPLGQVDTPYGSAVAYADGHVVWVPRGATVFDRRSYDCSSK